MVSYENVIKFVLIIFVILVIFVLLIKRFLYFRPSVEFLPYKDTYQDISEGKLHGWFLQGNNDKVIIYCHGNAGNISHRQCHIDAINNLGYSVLIFDYSGYGRSRGIPSESQFYHDASVFMNILIQKHNIKNIIAYGESIGAAVAAYIALKYQLDTLIIDSGLPSIKKYFKNKFNIIGFLSFIFPEFNTESYIEEYKGRILVMHSPVDEIIEYSTTDFIRAKATVYLELQGNHNDRIIPWDLVDKFIQKVKMDE